MDFHREFLYIRNDLFYITEGKIYIKEGKALFFNILHKMLGYISPETGMFFVKAR